MKRQKETYIISVTIFILILLLILITSLIYLAYIQKLIDENTLKNMGELTKQDAVKLQNQIMKHKEILENITDNIQKMNNVTEKEIFDIYENNIASKEFSRIAIMYENGKTSTSDGKIVDLSSEKEDFFTNSEVRLSKSRKSKVDEQEIVIYSKKIIINGEEIAILLVIETDKYEEIFAQSIYNGEGYEYIIDSNGEIIANSKNRDNGYNLFNIIGTLEDKYNKQKLEEMKEQIKQNTNGQVKYEVSGKYYYTSYKYLDINDWHLVIITPGGLIAQEYNKSIKTTFIVSIIINVVVVITAIYIMVSNKKKKEKLYELAYIDKVTNIGNNNYFIEKGTELLEKKFEGYLLIIDIDKFKAFNKKYGRKIGDELLRKLAEKLQKVLEKSEIIARLTNDIFSVILNEKEEKNLIKIVNKIINELSVLDIEKNKYKIIISIGISRIEKENKNIFEIMDKALIARNEAKGNFNKKYYIFNQELENRIVKEHEIELIMEEGIENREFKVFYQPKIDTKTEKVIEAEALVRWKRGDKLIPPNEFIPIFEKNKFIIQLDKYIFTQVCKDLEEWKERYKKQIKVSVNVSKEHLLEENFVEKYYKIAKMHNIKPEEIELEITETSAIDDQFDMKKILEKIRKKGFKISIDDFGTGYSSLNMLRQIPIDVIKIDKSFIDQIKMLETITLIAKKMKLKTVAEGVETKEQVQLLKQLEVDLLQGYYYSKPLEKEEFEKYWQNN